MTDVDLSTLAVCSVRYALGRQTYITYDVARIVRERWSMLLEQDQATIRRDIERALAEGKAGDPQIDGVAWYRLLNEVAHD